jgi:multiple sugar transport system permease protein
MPMRTHHRRGWVSTIMAFGLLGFMLFPVYWMVNVALQPDAAVVSVRPFPASPDFAAFATAIDDQGHHLLVSLAVSIGAVLVSLAVATPAAYALARFRLPGGNIAMLAILISQMIPGIVIANALYSAYNDLGILNTLPGLILADAALGIPFSILIIRAYIQAIPGSIMEAARVDGAGRLKVFLAIVVPVSRNALVTGALFTFLFAWSDFVFALTLTTGDAVRPITLGIYQYLGGYVSHWAPVMATAVLASLPAAVLLVIAQRFIATGITGGATKS